MKIRAPVFLLAFCALAALSAVAHAGSFLVANNDAPKLNPPVGPPGSSVTFYTLGADGSVTGVSSVATGGIGVGGGDFSYSRLAIVPQGSDVCVFAANAAPTPNIAGISTTSMAVTGNFAASSTDKGTANGIGLAANASFLYAAFSSTSTIATFSVEPGCLLSFAGDVFEVGLNGGLVGGMAIHGSMMIVTFGDGSIESFNITGGVPVSNGDVEISTGAAQYHLPNGVDITADGHYAVFGDASATTAVEVSDISSGKLTPTLAYSFGKGWNSSSVRLTPDESMIIVSNNSGGEVTALNFNKVSGKVTLGCTSAPLNGFYSSWSYAGAPALQLPTAKGGLIYVPEFGSGGFSSIGVVQLNSAGKPCTLSELATSPIVNDSNASALLSIGIYPVRPF